MSRLIIKRLREKRRLNLFIKDQASASYQGLFSNKETGKLGEEIALNFLKNKGYKIIKQNFIPKWSKGINNPEIDIIAKKQGSIIFIEVKALRVDCLDKEKFFPEDKVNFYKLRQIKKAIEFFLLENKISEDQKCQIDVLSVLIHKHSNQIKIKHFKNI